MSQEFKWPKSGSAGVSKYATFSALPAGASDGDAAFTLDTHTFYVYDSGLTAWKALANEATPNAVTSLTGDVTASGPGAAASTVVQVAGATAANVAAASAAVVASTSAATGSTLVKRDPSGNFSAGTITATLAGNASTATTATTATTAGSFSGALSGDVTGTQSDRKSVV